MRKIKSDFKFCIHCMEEHQIDIIEKVEKEIFKDEEITFNAIYQYCKIEDQLSETEEMLRINDLSMKDAYRKKVGLLSSNEIIQIRNKYKVSQKDFSAILNWGKATITRYENYQVQDRGNDNVLSKINEDPKWFLEMLSKAKDRISDKAFKKYHQRASELFKEKHNKYLVDSILSIYAEFDDTDSGGTVLNLDKVVEIINFIASHVESLHKVKLAKMLWFSDYLHYKRKKKSISGLVYSALPMGAVPEGYDYILLLDGVSFDYIWYGEHDGYKFKVNPNFKVKELKDEEIATIEDVISHFGKLNSKEIVSKMHEEDAYKYTGKDCIISFKCAESLSVS